jgi:hypothetical protein
MKEARLATVTGKILDERTMKRIKRDFCIVLTAVDGSVGPIEEVAKNGRYKIDRISAEVLYVVTIDGTVGLPAAICPAEGRNYEDLIYVYSADGATRDNAVASGRIGANNGTDLGGKQTYRWEDQATGTIAWPTTDTTDAGSYQTYSVTVVAQRTYEVYVNHCISVEQTCYPDPGSNPDVDFRRSSGTANVTVKSTESTTDDRVRIKTLSGTLVTPRAVTIPQGQARLISVPAQDPSTEFRFEIKQLNDAGFSQAQNSPTAVGYTPGSGSTPVEVDP